MHSEVQHTKYLLGQLYSEFANCLSEEHLISDRFAVIGTQQSVLLGRHSATTYQSIELIWAVALENGDSGGGVVPEFEKKLDSWGGEGGANKYSVKYCFSQVGFAVRANR